MPGQYDILRSFLSDKAIAFHPQLARVLGGINEAILFQQLAYWSDKGSDPDWIYKTQKDIEFETTLTLPPDVTAMGLNHSFADRETDTRACDRTMIMCPIERFENVRKSTHRYPYPLIVNAHHHAISANVCGDGNHRAIRRVMDRITYQIDQNLGDLNVVEKYDRQRGAEIYFYVATDSLA